MRPSIIPIGLSGNLVEIFEALTAVAVVPAILDEGPQLKGTLFRGIRIVDFTGARKYPGASFLCLVGSVRSIRARKDIIKRTGLPQKRFARFIHQSAKVSAMAELGQGVVLYDGALLTSNALLGHHVLVMPRAIIHHDVRIGDYSIVGAGVIMAGGVTVGPDCYIGSGACIRDGVSIGEGAVVGMGSVVVRDVAPGAVVAGNPARVLRNAAQPAE
ncbi:acetyltransferase [Paracoccus aerius]|uniref:Acetyltransferase n=1 Tax=Paracoccus aerius TaxID=1915382 RepID=A0ABS1S4M2_9RHOB|nr:acetyltransferase [Paracoccus aerius]MBL3673225.1 acetyltransferase [Paracoccus aerius]GHG17534.1 acetyltransferase [Paracoccus aerius]